MWSITNPQTDTCRENYRKQLLVHKKWTKWIQSTAGIQRMDSQRQTLLTKPRIYKKVKTIPSKGTFASSINHPANSFVIVITSLSISIIGEDFFSNEKWRTWLLAWDLASYSFWLLVWGSERAKERPLHPCTRINYS